MMGVCATRSVAPYALSLFFVVQLGAKSCVPSVSAPPLTPPRFWPPPLQHQSLPEATWCEHWACFRFRGGQGDAEEDDAADGSAERMEVSESGEEGTEADGAQEAMAMDTDAECTADTQAKTASKEQALSPGGDSRSHPGQLHLSASGPEPKLGGARRWRGQERWLLNTDLPPLRDKEEELRVPDHAYSLKEAISLALDEQTIYVRAGEHRWRGELQVPRNKTIFVRGELGSRLWGQWARRYQQPRAGVDYFCVTLPVGSQGSLACLILAHHTLGSFDACLQVI
jgi:hypothetical protein